MSNQGITNCEQAFKRLQNGKPKNKNYIGLLITPSLVSKEAGYDAGYLKSSRLAHLSLLNSIENYKSIQQEGGLKRKIAKLEAKLNESTNELNTYKKLFENSMSRELLLFGQLLKQ